MITAFKQYLLSLKLSPVSRKLYGSDVRRFLHWLSASKAPSEVQPGLDEVGSSSSYIRYLDSLRSQAIAPSMLKRTLASLRQFGNFISLTYSLPNPTLSAIAPAKADVQVNLDYIKHFTKYLESVHLSPLTIKSYKSDITRYLDWTSTHLPSTQLSELLIDKNIKKYLNHLTDSGSTLPSTIERKEKSITRFDSWYKDTYDNIHISDNNKNDLDRVTPGVTNIITSKRRGFDFPDSNQKTSPPDQPSFFVKNFNYRTVFAFAVLLVFATTLGIFGYRQFSRDVRLTAAYPSTPVTPNRQLSFQGRLENAAGTPITVATNLTFKLFSALTGPTELYSTGTCSITPDVDGVFSTQIGGTCGAAITSSIFTENSNIWLEVTVVSETLTPRQPIASVAYALNSETLQGLPIGTTTSTIPYLNSSNTISLTDSTPKLTGTTGTFTISAPSISITTATGTNGNITLAPDGTGQINLNGNTTSTNFFNVSNAQLTTGSLITGTAANGNTGFKLIDLLSGSSPTSKFSVTDTGLTTIASDLYLNSGLSTFGTAVSDDTIEATKFCTGDGETNCVTDFSSLGGSSYWSRTTGNLYPTSLNDTISATSSAAIALTITQTGAFNALLVQDEVSDTSPFVIDQSGNVGIGVASPTSKLQIGGTTSTISNSSGDLNINSQGNLVITTDGTGNGEVVLPNNSIGPNEILTTGQTDEYCLTYESTGGTWEWQTCGTGSGGNVALTDNTVSAYQIAEGLNVYLDITTTNDAESFTLNLPTGGATSHTANLFTANIAQTINLGTGTAINDINIGGYSTSHTDLTGVMNFAGSTTYYVDASGNAKFLDLIVADTANPGLTIGDGTTGYMKIGGSTLYDAAGSLTLDSDDATTIISDDLAISGGNITTALTADSSLTVTGTLTGNGIVNLGDGGDAIQLSGSSLILDIGGTDEITLTSSALSPSTSDSNALGTSTLMWSDLFLASGSVINFNNGDVTLTHSADLLTIAGGGLTASGTLTASGIVNLGDGGDAITINGSSLSLQTTGVGSDITLNAVDQILLPDYVSCTALETNSSGNLQCGADDIGSGASTTIDDAVNNDITDVVTLTHTTSGTATGGSSDTYTKALLHMDGADGSATFADDTGKTWTAGGNAQLDTAQSKFGGSSGLWDGNDYVDTPDNTDFDVNSGDFTVEAWLRTAASGAANRWFGQSDSIATATTISVYAGKNVSNYASCTVNSGSTSYTALGTTSLSDSAWHHMACVRDSDTLRVFVDGVQEGTANVTGITVNNSTYKPTVGRLGEYVTTPWNGWIDEFRFSKGIARWTSAFTPPTSAYSYNTNTGIGTGLLFRTEDASGTTENSARISGTLIDATSGSEDSSIVFETRAAGAALGRTMRLWNTGDLTISGWLSQDSNPDIAENIIVTDPTLSAGDIVMLDSSYVPPQGTNIYDRTATTKADTPYSQNILGVISTDPGIILNAPESGIDNKNRSEDNERPLTLAGRVPVKVNSENGEIQVGDYLTVSHTAGIGMKAVESGQTIGRAMEPFSCPAPSEAEGEVGCTGTILVMVGSSWYDPPVNPITSLKQFGTLIANSLKAQTLAVATISPLASGEPIVMNGPVMISHQPSDTPSLIVDGEISAATISARVAVLTDIQAETITAKNIIADTISANHIEGLDLKIDSSITDRIKNRLAELTGNIATAVDIPIPQEAIASQIPSEAIGEVGPTIATSSASIDFATINNYLAVIGSAIITTLDVTNGLYTDSIDSKSGRITLAEGTLVIDATGQVMINGDLTVSGLARLNEVEAAKIIATELNLERLNVYDEGGDIVATIDASGSANLSSLTTNMITIASSAIASESALASLIGTATSNATAGESILIAPNTELIIESPFITPNSLVYLTPTGNTQNKVLFVKSKDENSFTVGIDLPSPSDISFNWWIIQLEPKLQGTSP